VSVVEDAAESLGSSWVSGPLAGRHTGTVGLIGVVSFNGNKVVTTGGGGALLTADAELALRARYLIDQAKDDPVRYVHGAVGYNYRMPNPLAAIGVAQLEGLERFIATRRANFAAYRAQLTGVPGVRLLEPPEDVSSNMWFFPLLVDPAEAGLDREALMERLGEAGIQTRPLWRPGHLQAPFEGCTAVGVEKAFAYWERVLCLPCGSGLDADDVTRVASAVRAAVTGDRG
jgi:perosamine synthetase